MSFINTEKYRIVEEILNSPNYYRVLGIKKNASTEQVRRAYIKKSRISHPDKFVPPYPQATESFQILSMAYETLSDPASKLTYDLLEPNSQSPRASSFGSKVDPDATLTSVLTQMFNEISVGEFQTIRSFIRLYQSFMCTQLAKKLDIGAMNEINPALHISEDTIHQMELGFQKITESFGSTKQYCHIVQFELMKLYELQQELRCLSYFSLWRRMQVTLSMVKILVQLPIIISAESKKRQLLKLKDASDKQVEGLLNQKIENALQMAIELLEAGEKYTASY